MTEEFNLSGYIHCAAHCDNDDLHESALRVADVKEFIKRCESKKRNIQVCKECGSSSLDDTWCYSCSENTEIIDNPMIELSKIYELAGEKLC